MRALLLAALLFPQAEDVEVRLRVADGGTPIFARVTLRDAAGKLVGSNRYSTLSGRFVPPEGWTVRLPKGRYRLAADAGFEFFRHEEDWAVDGAGEKKIELKRWVNLRKEGWVSGGDHNHLTREGSENKNYGGTPVTLEFAAAAMASRGWAYFAAGGGGPWILEDKQTLHSGRRTEPACEAWNRKYGEHLALWWNNEAIKGRYGHVWFLGKSAPGPTWPYTDRPADAWWSLYDGRFDLWQQGDTSKPLPSYANDDGPLPPIFDCAKSWRERGLLSVFAHPTRTFTIGKNRVTNLAVELPFDLLAGAPVGAIAIMGDHPDHREDQALWFAALNEGFQLAGVAENDTVFGRADLRASPHATYTRLPGARGPVDFGALVEAIAAGRNFASSGAFLILRLDGKATMGDTVAADGKEHALEIRAWASADPADAIEALEVIADGKVVRSVAEARGKRAYEGSVPVRAAGIRWVAAKVLCRNRAAAAVANPIYFRAPGEPRTPEPLRAAVSGRVTRAGAGVPAEIEIRVWGKEAGRAKAGPDGRYTLKDVPIAAHLRFTHEGAAASRVLFFDDPRLRAIHERIFRTEFVGAADALAGCFPPDFFATLRSLARSLTIDAELK